MLLISPDGLMRLQFIRTNQSTAEGFILCIGRATK